MGTTSVTPEDRLGLTLCFAIIVHAVVILGVSFSPPDKTPPRFDPLDVILVQQRGEAAPKEAQYLAQADLEGGGEEQDKVSPAAPLHAPFPDDKPEIALMPTPPGRASPPKEAMNQDLKVAAAKPLEQPADGAGRALQHDRHKELVAETTAASKRKTAPISKPRPEHEPARDPVNSGPVSDPALPDAAALIANSFAMASLNAEIAERLEARAKRPRRKFVSATTREYKFAAYMEAWRAKVERIGNLNYPEEARRQRITGSLILDVALEADGSVYEITIRRPSGRKVLDDAAVRIVELAAPYAPFPKDISREVDILHITRSWQFLHTYGRFASK